MPSAQSIKHCFLTLVYKGYQQLSSLSLWEHCKLYNLLGSLRPKRKEDKSITIKNINRGRKKKMFFLDFSLTVATLSDLNCSADELYCTIDTE